MMVMYNREISNINDSRHFPMLFGKVRRLVKRPSFFCKAMQDVVNRYAYENLSTASRIYNNLINSFAGRRSRERIPFLIGLCLDEAGVKLSRLQPEQATENVYHL